MVDEAMLAYVPDVYLYTDFRAFLGDCYAALKARNPKVSHRFIHQRVGATSSGWFTDVVKGRIALTGRFLVRLAAFLGLKARQARYFEAMVSFAQAGSAEERERHLQTMLSFQELRMDKVGRDQFEFYGRWYHAVVRELLCFHGFDGSYEALGRRLDPPITAKQAKRSVELLLKLDLIRKDAQGRYRPTSTLLRKDPAFKAINIHRFLCSFSELAMDAQLRVEKDRRDISCLTLALSEEAVAEAKADLAELRRKLLERAAKEARPAQVYHCNLQFFPVSK